MPPRTVMVIGAVCLTIGWLLASTLSPPVARLQSLPERQPPGRAATEEAPFAEQLRLRHREAVVAPALRRNPFRFGDREREPLFEVPQPPQMSAAAPASPGPPPAPALTLAGIGITGDERTAILTDGSNVQIVKVGDSVLGYEVVEVTEGSVTLVAPSGSRLLLNLP